MNDKELRQLYQPPLPAGLKINDWTVIKPANPNEEFPEYYIVKCRCGKYGSLKGSYLRTGQPTHCRSCGHNKSMDKIRNNEKLTLGETLNNWKVIASLYKTADGIYHYQINHTCGASHIISAKDFKLNTLPICQVCINKKNELNDIKQRMRFDSIKDWVKSLLPWTAAFLTALYWAMQLVKK